MNKYYKLQTYNRVIVILAILKKKKAKKSLPRDASTIRGFVPSSENVALHQFERQLMGKELYNIPKANIFSLFRMFHQSLAKLT